MDVSIEGCVKLERVLTWGCMCELVRLRGFMEAMTVGTMRMMMYRMGGWFVWCDKDLMGYVVFKFARSQLQFVNMMRL